MKKIDTLWSVAVKSKAGYRCEYEQCGSNYALNSHHLFSRRFLSTRYLIENGICLCVKHHFYFHQHPLPSSLWVIKERGKPWYNALERQSKIIKPRLDLAGIEKELKAIIEANPLEGENG